MKQRSFVVAAALSFCALPSIASAGDALPIVSDGEGQVILFVHGSISDHRVWEPIRETVAEEARAVAYDMRYFGEADWPDAGEGFSIDAHVADLIGLIEELDAGPVDLVTWSYSGEIGIKAALERPELFRAMVHYEPVIPSLIEGLPGAEAADAEMTPLFGPAIARLKAGDTETAALRFVEVVFKWEEGQAEREPAAWQEIWKLNGRTLPVQFAAPPGHQLRCADLAELAVPTLVIAGSETYARYALTAATLADCLPDAELASFDGYGHDGPYAAPDRLAEVILGFSETP